MKRHLDLASGPARRTPDKTAIVEGDRRLTFAELDDRVERLAAVLRDRGMRPGDRLALLAANELEYPEVQGACLRGGFTLVPLNKRLAVRELEYIVADATPSVMIAGADEEARVKEIAPAAGRPALLGLGAPERVDPYDAALTAAAPDPEGHPLADDLTTTFLYTSGTTGRPKGAMIDRAGFTARCFVNAVETDARPDDAFVLSLPMYHIACFLVFGYMTRGATVVMLPTFTPQAWTKAVTREGGTSTVMVPTMIQMLLDDPAMEDFDASTLRLMIYGGAPIDAPLLRRAMDRLGCGFHQQYGMTETGAQTVLRPGDHDPADPDVLGSAGMEAVSFDVMIADADDRSAAAGEVGEIVCRGPAVMSGYWNLPDVTRETLRNGWMHTGDVGYRDDRGYLHVIDRRNDMIITGGENVYPREVEAALAEHPEVPEVAVIGLPDSKWGQVVVGVVAGDAPSDEALTAFLRDRIAGYKLPRRWVHVEELPRNATGKVLKGELRAELADPDVSLPHPRS